MNRDRKSEEILTSYLSSCPLFSSCICYGEIGSTNDACRALSLSGAPEGTVVVAESQTAGRGRQGRTFFSPQDGLYMSLLLKPKVSFSDFGLITACAAVAVREAIRETLDVSVDIKWVNDLYFQNKKLCGILAEGCFSGQDAFVVLGIGVNIKPPADGYAPDIENIATSLCEIAPDHSVDRLQLCAEIIRQFNRFYAEIENREFLAIYRVASCVVGREVTFVQEGKNMQAKAIGIDDDAHLIVETEAGETLYLSTGEVNFLRPVL